MVSYYKVAINSLKYGNTEHVLYAKMHHKLIAFCMIYWIISKQSRWNLNTNVGLYDQTGVRLILLLYAEVLHRVWNKTTLEDHMNSIVGDRNTRTKGIVWLIDHSHECHRWIRTNREPYRKHHRPNSPLSYLDRAVISWNTALVALTLMRLLFTSLWVHFPSNTS